MGVKYQQWVEQACHAPSGYEELREIIHQNRSFHRPASLNYGNHGLDDVLLTVEEAIRSNKRIALYADYDVDGTMSCVSWIWFLRYIGYENFIHYIPCRFREGYGFNLYAIRHLIHDEKAELVITMDTGITANEEAAYCKEQGVAFICTDHHKLQPEKMPDCLILNPKLHPEEEYQELCGCAITYVLLRSLGRRMEVTGEIWTDLLALTGMATICDLVPLNGVNHQLARMGVQALWRSRRPIIRKLLESCSVDDKIDESDIGFRLGPRINAVGRLEHADQVIEAFVSEEADALIEHMGSCNDRRKQIQGKIVKEAQIQARKQGDTPILFLGGDWHPGVVGIAASKLADEFWRPVWLFQKKDGICKGSTRSIPGFDVTEAMGAASEHFKQFGGHQAAGGFLFEEDKEEAIRNALTAYANEFKQLNPSIWQSKVEFDCSLPIDLASLDLMDVLDELKPFGHGFPEPRFCIETEVLRTQFYQDKKTGEPRHTAVTVRGADGQWQKIMFFQSVYPELVQAKKARFVVSASRNTFRGNESLSLLGHDFEVLDPIIER